MIPKMIEDQLLDVYIKRGKGLAFYLEEKHTSDAPSE
jgi:hypothetical protein